MPYQILSIFLLACCFVAVFLLFSAEKQQANSNPTATWREGCKDTVFEKRCYRMGKNRNIFHRGSVHTLHFYFFTTAYLCNGIFYLESMHICTKRKSPGN